jgi:hypothetical protein
LSGEIPLLGKSFKADKDSCHELHLWDRHPSLLKKFGEFLEAANMLYVIQTKLVGWAGVFNGFHIRLLC